MWSSIHGVPKDMWGHIIDVEFHTWSSKRYGGFYNRCGLPYRGVPKDMGGSIIDVEFHKRCGVP
jgi:hypothetical protein